MIPSVAFIDFETYSEVDLKKAGGWRYAEDPSTEILCLAVSFDRGEPVLWEPSQGLDALRSMAAEIAARDEVWAWNAHFEVAIWEAKMVALGCPMIRRDKWRCSMALAMSCGLPGRLEDAGAVLGAHVLKDPKGGAVMRKLSRPRKQPTMSNPRTRWTPETAPEDFATLYAYCRQDVCAEIEVHRLLPVSILSPEEQTLWQEDLRANAHGIAVDVEAVRRISAEVASYKVHAGDRVRAKTNVSPSQRDALLRWFQSEGIEIADLRSETLEKLLEDETLPAHVRDVVELRVSSSQISTKKFSRILEMVCSDGRLRGQTQIYGAGTGRWAGRGVQLQNLPSRGVVKDAPKIVEERFLDWRDLAALYDDPMHVYASCVRPVLTASPGMWLTCVDYKAIEARGVAWLADCRALLTIFERGGDPYVDLAARVFKIPAAEVRPDVHRPVGKEGILGCGYGMGKDKFADRLRVQGIEVARDVSDSVVDTYRAEYHEIPELWASMNAAAIAAVESPGRITEGAPRGRIWFKCFEMHGVRWLVMRLPSGRRIFYHEPRLEPGQYGPEITYGRVDQRTRRWGRAKTYGGKLVENAVQAIARDIMADAILHMRGSDVFYLLSVHDEIIAESESTDALWWLQATMRKAPPWAAGFPIEVEGWSGPRYRK